mgnify:CR=1 FL=1
MDEFKVIAVDADGTLWTYQKGQYPTIGRPIWDIINKLIKMRKKGWKLILWTCRYGSDLDAAVEWCKNNGLEFDALNENLQQSFALKKAHGSPKIYGTYYLDDRALSLEKFLEDDFYEN